MKKGPGFAAESYMFSLGCRSGDSNPDSRTATRPGRRDPCVFDLIEPGQYSGQFRRRGKPGRCRNIWSAYLAYHVGGKQGRFVGEFKACHDDRIFEAQRCRQPLPANLVPGQFRFIDYDEVGIAAPYHGCPGLNAKPLVIEFLKVLDSKSGFAGYQRDKSLPDFFGRIV